MSTKPAEDARQTQTDKATVDASAPASQAAPVGRGGVAGAMPAAVEAADPRDYAAQLPSGNDAGPGADEPVMLHLADFAGRALDTLDTVRRRNSDGPIARTTATEEQSPAKKGKLHLVNRGKKPKRDRHARRKVAFFRYTYYDIAFKFCVEHVLDADFVQLPEPTRRTVELGSANSNDFVCAPFKHILGDYIEALELGADVLVQFTGPCRLGYYGEMQEAILRDMGYEFDMLNFATCAGKPVQEYVAECKRKVNPDMSVSAGIAGMLTVFKMVECLDAYNDYYLAHAGFEAHKGDFARARERFFEAMRAAATRADVEAAFAQGIAEAKAIEVNRPADPVRVGIVGEYFTAVDAPSNLHIEDKLLGMHVELARLMNLTNRNIRYNEPNLRASIPEYAAYDGGPTSSLTIAAAKKYAQEGFDGIVHIKSSGCTPEIDCMPALQRIGREYGIPVLYLSFDSQTSDTGLDTRLEAFYDMIAMRKAR